MNGRVYDPVLARFLRSDPVVSDPMSAQTYNGYSYVGNNPLAATDPSGYVLTHSFSTGGSNYANYNFNTGGGSSNSFSFMGGTFSISIGGGGYDPFENQFSSGNSAMIGMQARYMSLFGAPAIFNGLPNVVTPYSYMSAANAGRGGNSVAQCVFGSNSGWVTDTRTGRVVRSGTNTAYGFSASQGKYDELQDAAFSAGTTVGRIGASMVPGVGEAMDAEVIADPTSSLVSRSLASVSLGISILSDGFAPNYGALRRGAKRMTGQIHHAISTKVARAIDRHPILKGVFAKRDPRFVTQAIDGAAHRGYQRWHRDLDDEVVKWIEDNESKNADDFLAYLRELYNRPDIKARFPEGF